MINIDYHAIAPELILSVALLAVLVVDLFLPEKYKPWNAALSIAGLAGAFAAVMTLVGDRRETFDGAFVMDSYALLFKVFFLLVGIAVVLLSLDVLKEGETRPVQGEFYFLLLTSFLGMLLIASSRDLLMLFIALEMISIPGFIVAGFKRTDPKSTEAAVKFFLIGVLSAAVMLFGMSLIYGVARSTNLAEIATALAGRGDDPLVFMSVFLIIVGFAFKVSAVPFHFWAPDTYEGSPVPVAAFLSVASKAAGFAGLLTVTFVGFPTATQAWGPGLAILAAATMTIGNVVALAQTNMVRLLAYSSIAQAGYMLLPFGLVAGQGPEVLDKAFAASLSYILIYSFMNLGAFAVVIVMSRRHGANEIADYDGLAQRQPMLALAMAFFLLSLAGIPPLAGFWAKFFVFSAAMEAGTVWLAVVMVVNSVIGLYYYLSVASKMYLREAKDTSAIPVPAALGIAIVVMVLLVIAVGFYPDIVNHFSPRATLVAL